jgi:hypothetical protein
LKKGKQCEVNLPSAIRRPVTSASSFKELNDSEILHTKIFKYCACCQCVSQTHIPLVDPWENDIWLTLWPEMSAAWAARGEGVGPRTLGHSQLLVMGLYTTSWLFQPRGKPDSSVLGSITCWNGTPNSGFGPKPPKKYSLQDTTIQLNKTHLMQRWFSVCFSVYSITNGI